MTSGVHGGMHATMSRTARLDTPGLLHHIMIRGIERRKIFNDDKDREWTGAPHANMRFFSFVCNAG